MESTARGEGAELRTDGAAALRAAQGMLLTTQAQVGAKGEHLERDALLQLLAQTQELVKTLAEAAQAQRAVPADPAAQQAQHEGLAQWDGGSNIKPNGTGGGQPLLAIYGEAGIAARHLQVDAAVGSRSCGHRSRSTATGCPEAVGDPCRRASVGVLPGNCWPGQCHRTDRCARGRWRWPHMTAICTNRRCRRCVSRREPGLADLCRWPGKIIAWRRGVCSRWKVATSICIAREVHGQGNAEVFRRRCACFRGDEHLAIESIQRQLSGAP
uniref:type VI secretion system Vgr family protein n=1 Tax=Xanthomonas oryzae TaxID=347 RepID=UPI003DA0B8E8